MTDEEVLQNADVGAAALDDDAGQRIVTLLEEVRDNTEFRPLMTTSFDDYTVTEGLLLTLVLCVVGRWCVKMIKGGFSWLLS